MKVFEVPDTHRRYHTCILTLAVGQQSPQPWSGVAGRVRTGIMGSFGPFWGEKRFLTVKLLNVESV